MRITMKIQTIIVLFIFWFCASTVLYSQNTFVRNTLDEINRSEGKIKLSLVRVWGDDDEDDENLFFRFPADIKIGKDNKVYISDSGNHTIKVFDRNATHIRNIGRKGQGPGDLLDPEKIAFDSMNNLVVMDSGNRRVQCFNRNGESSYIFKTTLAHPTSFYVTQDNYIVFDTYHESLKTGNLISIFDTTGKLSQKVGTNYKKVKTTSENEAILFAIDNYKNIIVAYNITPFYWIYSDKKIVKKIVAFDMKERRVVQEPGNPNKFKLEGKMDTNAASGLSIDHKNRVFIITTNRPMAKSEEFFLVGGAGSMKRFPKKIPSDKTDRFRLLVFNEEGKIIAAKKLNVFCDGLYVHKDSLFIIDTYMGMKIYEYKIKFI